MPQSPDKETMKNWVMLFIVGCCLFLSKRVRADEIEVRPILFDLGVLSIKDRPQFGDDVEPIRASDLLGDQQFMAIHVKDKKIELSRSASSGEILIDGLSGCAEVFFYSDSIGCQLTSEYGHRPNMLHLNYRLEALIGPREREILDEKMVLCDRGPEVDLSQAEAAIFEDVYYIKMELASLRGAGVSPKTGLYIEEDRITERERVLDSFTRFWSAQDKDKFLSYEQARLRRDLASHQFETSYLGCAVGFSFGADNSCYVEGKTALQIDRERFGCSEIALRAGKLWCDDNSYEFKATCPLGALAGRAVAGSIPQGEAEIYDGPRAGGKDGDTSNPAFNGSRAPGKVLSK